MFMFTYGECESLPLFTDQLNNLPYSEYNLYYVNSQVITSCCTHICSSVYTFIVKMCGIHNSFLSLRVSFQNYNDFLIAFGIISLSSLVTGQAFLGYAVSLQAHWLANGGDSRPGIITRCMLYYSMCMYESIGVCTSTFTV